MVGMRRSLVTVVVAAVIAPLALSGCGDKQKSAAAATAGPTPGASVSAGPSGAPDTEAATVPISLSVTPASGKTGVPTSAEVAFQVSGAKVTSVTLTDSKGKAVVGALRDDGSSWVPGKTLKTKERYAASVVATSASGLTRTVRTSF